MCHKGSCASNLDLPPLVVIGMALLSPSDNFKLFKKPFQNVWESWNEMIMPIVLKAPNTERKHQKQPVKLQEEKESRIIAKLQ